MELPDTPEEEEIPEIKEFDELQTFIGNTIDYRALHYDGVVQVDWVTGEAWEKINFTSVKSSRYYATPIIVIKRGVKPPSKIISQQEQKN